MKKVLLVSAITLSAMLVAPSQTSSDQAKKSPVEGTWEFVAAPRLSPPRKEIKIILGGHFVFARYNAETGNLIYAGGGTYTLNSTSYTEKQRSGKEEPGGRHMGIRCGSQTVPAPKGDQNHFGRTLRVCSVQCRDR